MAVQQQKKKKKNKTRNSKLKEVTGKKVKKLLAQQSAGLEWNCRVAVQAQVGDDNGVTGMGVYTASKQ